MNTTTWIELADKFGTNIIMLFACGYFIYYMFNKFLQKDEEVRKENSENTKLMSEALNNNTIALAKLAERLSNDSKN